MSGLSISQESYKSLNNYRFCYTKTPFLLHFVPQKECILLTFRKAYPLPFRNLLDSPWIDNSNEENSIDYQSNINIMQVHYRTTATFWL